MRIGFGIKALASAGWAALFAACAAPSPPVPNAALAQALHRSAMRAAAQPGAMLCRQLEIGIGGSDWRRGQVVAVAGDSVDIRVTDAGRFPQLARNEPLAPGKRLRVDPIDWTPCL